MTYVIKTTGEKGILFLVDRNITKKFWWSYKLSIVKRFKTREDAEKACSKLNFNSPVVITFSEAQQIRDEIESNYEFTTDYNPHPFSCEGLGQWMD